MIYNEPSNLQMSSYNIKSIVGPTKPKKNTISNVVIRNDQENEMF